MADALTAELLEASRRVLDAALPKPATGFDPSPHVESWDKLRPQLQQLGWFDLQGAADAGGLGLAPSFAVRLVRLAGSYLVPGPVVESVLTVPWLLGQTGSALLQDTLVVVDPTPELALEDDRLHGSALCVLGAGQADALLVHAGEQLLVLPSHHPGVSIAPLRGADPCQAVAHVAFDCAVGEEHLLEASAPRLRAWTRLGDAAYLAGICERALSFGVDHALVREQFGRPIGGFQAVQHLLAGVAVTARSLSNVVDFAAHELPDANEDEAVVLAAAAKARAGTGAVLACETVLQVLGGMGFTVDHPLHHYLKRALSLTARHGSPAELHLLTGRSVLATRSRTTLEAS